MIDFEEKYTILMLLKYAHENMGLDFKDHVYTDLNDFNDHDAINLISELWFGEDYALHLEDEIDEDTGEFANYTGMLLYDFTHPAINEFYKYSSSNSKLFEELRDEVYKLEEETWRAFYGGNIFVDFIYEEDGEEIQGIRYTFDSLNKPYVFIKALYEYISYLEEAIKKIKEEKEGFCAA